MALFSLIYLFIYIPDYKLSKLHSSIEASTSIVFTAATHADRHNADI